MQLFDLSLGFSSLFLLVSLSLGGQYVVAERISVVVLFVRVPIYLSPFGTFDCSFGSA